MGKMIYMLYSRTTRLWKNIIYMLKFYTEIMKTKLALENQFKIVMPIFGTTDVALNSMEMVLFD